MNTFENRKNAYTRDELVLCGTGELFGSATAKLPTGNMLMFDRIVSITGDGGTRGKGCIEAELDIRPDLWFFGCHFVEDPVMPGCLGLDALWQLCGFFLAWSGCEGKGRALGAGKVKFTGQILPTAKKVTYTLEIKRLIARKLSMLIADGTVAVDGRKIYTAEDLRVGLFSSTDSFQGKSQIPLTTSPDEPCVREAAAWSIFRQSLAIAAAGAASTAMVLVDRTEIRG